ncbi:MULTISPECIES: hypothetical protein [Weeksellaceae]|uniref:AbiTii domain-containing protein n=2 Tax=Flavobacteriales TaxID=200644 RepID=UPI0028A77ED5|nr:MULTISPECIES: hypothetical protein [Weeksellaceae]
MNIKSLIEDIIVGMANNEPLTNLVSKIQVVSKLLKNEEFKTWVDNEFIYGYNTEDDLPVYRNIHVLAVKASFVQHLGLGLMKQYTNFEVPILNLGSDKYKEVMQIPFKETIVALDQMMLQQKGNIHYSLNGYEKYLIQQKILQDCEVSNIYKIISRYSITNIIDQAKAKLLDTFIELNDSVFNNELNFNLVEKKEDIAKIVHQTINTGVYISDNSSANIQDTNIVGGTNNKVEFHENFEEDVLNLTAKIEQLAKDLDEERDEIAFEICKIKLALEKKESPKIIKSAFNAIKGIVTNVVSTEITDLLTTELPKINF